MSESVTASAVGPVTVSSVAITSAISALTADSSRRRSTCDRAGSRSATFCASKSVSSVDSLARLPSAGAASGNSRADDQKCSWHTAHFAAWPDCAGQPAVCADPCNGPAGGQIEYVCAAAECIDPWLGAGVRPLESPAAREAEGVGAALHEDDHLQGISGDLVVHPEFCAALVRVNRHQKAAGERAFAGSFLHENGVQIERAGGVVRRPDVEQTGEVGEVISHVGLQKSRSP